MNRLDVIQKSIDKINAKHYLEIGVFAANTFMQVSAAHKIAVDPDYNISLKKKFKWIVLNPCNISNSYFKITSDEYFKKHQSNKKLDVVFVDGLHTYEQSLKDVLNSLEHLNENGIIVMHDCLPPNEDAALPVDSYEASGAGVWTGDVWKTVCHLRSMRDDLNVFVLDCDFGLGIVTKGKPESMLNYSKDEINNLSYQDLIKNRKEILNLKEPAYIDTFLATK